MKHVGADGGEVEETELRGRIRIRFSEKLQPGICVSFLCKVGGELGAFQITLG